MVDTCEPAPEQVAFYARLYERLSPLFHALAQAVEADDQRQAGRQLSDYRG